MLRDFKITWGLHQCILPDYYSDYEFTIIAHRKGLKIIGDKNLTYCYLDYTSGNNKYLEENPRNTIKKVFSKKSVYNLIYGLSYIILNTHWYILPIAISNKIYRYVHNILVYLFSKLKHN